MKKALSLILALALVFSLGITAAAFNQTVDATITYRAIKIVVNGQAVNPQDASGNSVEPFILGGTTYLPVRAVAGALGLNVAWDADTSTVTLTSGGAVSYGSGTPAASTAEKTVSITYRDIKLVIDGAAVTPKDASGSTVEPFILDGTTYLPVRAVASALGADVGWDAGTSTVTLTSAAQTGENGGAEPIYLLTKELSTITYDSDYASFSVTSKTEYRYDGNNNLVYYGITSDSVNFNVTYTYDSKDQLVKAVSSGDEECTETYTYDADGNLTGYKAVYSDGTLESVYTYQSGLLMKEASSVKSGDSTAYSSTITYTYDSQDQVIKIEEYSIDRNSGYSYTSTTSYTYDGKGNVLTEHMEDSDYSYSGAYTYDAHGNVLTYKYTNSLGTGYTVTYTYDSNENLLTERCAYSDYSSSETYTYDTHGNVLTYTYASTGGISYKYTCTYDSKGQLVKLVSSGSDEDNMTCTYSYDAHGNLIKEESLVSGCTIVTTYEYVLAK